MSASLAMHSATSSAPAAPSKWLLFGASVAALWGVALAAPVPGNIASTMGNTPTVYMAIVFIASLGTVLGACVCCRRRKKGFEEFENESAAHDAAARTTEFPIFRALSTPQSARNDSTVNSSSSSLATGSGASAAAAATDAPSGSPTLSAHQPPMVAVQPPSVHAVPAQLALPDGLVVPLAGRQVPFVDHRPQQPQAHPHDVVELLDNNNGPISPADLQNIANNNALEFIPNLNEVAAAEAAAAIVAQQIVVDVQPDLVLELPLNASAALVQQTNSPFYSSFGERNPFADDLNKSTTIAIDDDDEDTTEAAVRLGDVRIDIDDQSTEEPLLQRTYGPSAMNRTPVTRLPNVVVGGRSAVGYQMLSSGETEATSSPVSFFEESPSDCKPSDEETPAPNAEIVHDEQSDAAAADATTVEDALRALDFAISGGGDDDDDSDDDNEASVDDDLDLDVGNGDPAAEAIASNVLREFLLTESANHQENIAAEAGRLVDEVLQQAEQAVAERQRQPEARPIADDEATELPPFVSTSPPQEEVNDSFDEPFDFEASLPIEASTPFVSKAFVHDGKPKKVFHNLFANVMRVEQIASPNADYSLDDLQIRPLPVPSDDATFDGRATDATFNAAADATFTGPLVGKPLADATFDASPAANETFAVADATFDALPAGATNNVPPEIKISAESSESASVDLTTATPVNTPIELNYSLDSWGKFISSSMQQKPPESTLLSADNALPSSVERPNDQKQTQQAIGNETFEMNSSGWFVPTATAGGAADGTFDVNGTVTLAADDDENDEDTHHRRRRGGDEDDDEDVDQLSLTFDALRKQLAEALPHAQGSMAGATGGNGDFSDDDEPADSDMLVIGSAGSGSESDFDFEPVQSSAQAELHINYNCGNVKRALSPIAEESEGEDESLSCKTFLMNDTTKCLDDGLELLGAAGGTAAVCATGAADSTCSFPADEDVDVAMLGVTKTLMASNDTLFNFEDTLGDRDDLMSPRTLTSSASAGAVHHDMSRSTSNTSSVYDSRTPTADAEAHPQSPTRAIARNFQPLDLATATIRATPLSSVAATPSDQHNGTEDIFVPEWDAAFASAAAVADLLSPDQQKTFSEDICTTIIEHGGGGTSSDLSLTIDATFSGTDDRTCITAGGLDAPNGVGVPSAAGGTTSEDGVSRNGLVSEEEGFGDVEEGDADEKSTPSKDGDICAEPEKAPTAVASKELQLSGEEDPWARSIDEDIRFSGPSDAMMSTSFSNADAASNKATDKHSEWDSDVDDSSEEFEYVKGEQRPDVPSAAESSSADDEDEDEAPTTHDDDDEASKRIDSLDAENVWQAHTDKIAVRRAQSGDGDEDDDNADDDNDDNSSGGASSEAEGEWVPSCWDSMAQPVRSALKSPDKTSSSSANKKRRSVAFKKQNYHSVYEYPKEVALSPAYSEPKISSWERNFAIPRTPTASIFDAPAFTKSNAAAAAAATNDATTDLQDLDGFTITSSSRPFQGSSQFSAQCHTWPSTDFSWSQISDDTDMKKSDPFTSYSDMQLNWPKGLGDFFCSEQIKDADCTDGGASSSSYDQQRLSSLGARSDTSECGTRPDSGVGESSQGDALTDSLGDLCHTKASLRLPLNLLAKADSKPHTGAKKKRLHADDNEDDGDDEDDADLRRRQQRVLLDAILPTPSCTGSMDSLSSSSGSERQVSFTTFGKRSQPSMLSSSPPPASSDAPASVSSASVGFPMKMTEERHGQANDSDTSASSSASLGASSCVPRPALIFIDSAVAPSSPAHDGIIGALAVHPANSSSVFRATKSADKGQSSSVGDERLYCGNPLTATMAAAAASKQQNDSTDEDSGIESIMRISKEPNQLVN